ncbi:uncharacterized membrane protein YhaH (DUF805 family) [Parabacteroides sp. PF5-5]|uniref:hypothetical protein n=1 Tax=unclassified Parabacteroides TaxID=2649774 RepID=UPI002475653B|nr:MULTISPECIES: hypothetical protein [unclassified Parabacteroides]MDH6305263.1 uncharacterized membrane protein YhaH (DUF805 family) [Parabacteroides sp. PH5-39]MDH6316616.1 uncharacterized membrane protein YhaH (DUF805 family) [Parabacteroides sp. PF5-13]MDH6320204.1 uncharacterized membrane protein YhaH (DUF805 family) [Parabacteroides sp. PH5-13]MDH6323853.1 uncharacterized membrane protein YhaH (DUF805 family) [Parabacteroides sp. PH5-8]MDH6327881.1 uncharacterized membrane protein YhaH 
MISTYLKKIYPLFLSPKSKKQFEKIIFFTAIIAFIIHFTLIVLADLNYIQSSSYSNNGKGLNPISSIYTPFSIILLYEIYLLIYYLPTSITIYLGKQYEIIALILVRKIFDDLANLPIGSSYFDYETVEKLLLTFGGLIALFLLIFLFYKLSGNKPERTDEYECKDEKSRKFVIAKKIMSLILLLLFGILFIRSFSEIKDAGSLSMDNIIHLTYKMNNTFFDTFFTALIITEVLLLLFTFELSDHFNKVIRNSGFIVSTILLKLSFKAEGLLNVGIILVAVAFGVAILSVHKLYETKL